MGELYATETWLQVLFVTVILGGGAACLAGRAIAGTWRPFWHAVGAMLILAAGVRFVHYALFEATLLSPASYMADAAFLLLVGCLAWRFTLAGKMVRQYDWLYERSGPLSWRPRSAVPAGTPPNQSA
jgi:hypothetical protein